MIVMIKNEIEATHHHHRRCHHHPCWLCVILLLLRLDIAECTQKLITHIFFTTTVTCAAIFNQVIVATKMYKYMHTDKCAQGGA